MDITIDQSNKIEYTSQDTVIAYANGKKKSLLIKAKDKRILEKLFRQANKPDIFVYKTFAILLFLLIKDDIKKIHSLTIDHEYWGKEPLIKNFLLQTIRKNGFVFAADAIHFGLIGKKDPSHIKAITTYRKKDKPDLIVSFKKVLKEEL